MNQSAASGFQFVSLKRPPCPRCGNVNARTSDIYISRAMDKPAVLVPRPVLECDKCGLFLWLDEQKTGVKK